MSHPGRSAAAASILLIALHTSASDTKKEAKAPELEPFRCREVVVRDRLAYVAFSRTLTLQDVSKPDGPRTLGKIDFPHEVRRIVLAGARAYLALGTSGVAAVDIANPKAPTLLGRFDTQGSVRDVAAVGGILFLADDIQGITIADLADPEKPYTVASIPMSEPVRSIAAEAGLLAAANGSAGVRLFDVSKPGVPQRLATLAADSPAEDVALCEPQRLLVGVGRSLEVYDVQDRAHPRRIASLPTPGPVRGVSCRDRRAAVACGNEGVLLVDLRESPPRVRATVRLPRGSSAESCSLEADLLFVGADLAGLGVVDIADPDAPRILLPRARKMSVRFEK